MLPPRTSYLVLVLLLLAFAPAWAQEEGGFTDLDNELEFVFERQITFGNGTTPLWLNANRYGLSSVDSDNGYLAFGVEGSKTLGNGNSWFLNFGAEIAVAYNNTSSFIIQQLYGQLQFRKLALTIGSKERPMNLKNQELSSGSFTLGINSRPIPEVTLETPEYFRLLRGNDWVKLKFRFGYGVTTDWNWQEDFTNKQSRYTGRTWVHTQAGFLRVGDESKFPLVFEGGLEWASEFGGTAYNVSYSGGTIDKLNMSESLSSFFKSIYGGGSDPTDMGYDNAEGNTLGSWLLRLSYKFPFNTRVSLYYDHFFEDHSQLFWEYGWKDGLYGIEVELPRNPVVSNVVYEYVTTTDQTGPIYHDATSAVSDQISAVDNYYNHTIYTGWQHWGQAIGNPLFTSPLYNSDGRITFTNNRYKAHHIGLAGDPIKELHYRLLYTYSTNWGTYNNPFADKKYSTSFLAELTYSPTRLGHWDVSGTSLRLGFGFDRGELLGDNNAFQVTLISRGLLTNL